MFVSECNINYRLAFSEVVFMFFAGRGAAQRGWGPTGCRSIAAAGFCPVPACAVPVIFVFLRVLGHTSRNELSFFRSRPVLDVTSFFSCLYSFVFQLFIRLISLRSPTTILCYPDIGNVRKRPHLRQLE